MKKQILTIGTVVLFAFGSATFIGCGNAKEHHEDENMEHMEGEEHHDNMEMTDEHMDEMEETDGEEHHAMYQCPMKCEGDKTYDEPGKCPKCGMDMEEVK